MAIKPKVVGVLEVQSTLSNTSTAVKGRLVPAMANTAGASTVKLPGVTAVTVGEEPLPPVVDVQFTSASVMLAVIVERML